MTTIVHCLYRGAALCGRNGPPGKWPSGNSWVGFEEWPEMRGSLEDADARCPVCDAAWLSMNRDLKPKPKEKTHVNRTGES